MSDPIGTDQSLSAGALLRRAREASGLHIAALAVGMKVSVKKLEALEADQYELLGDPVFVRAIASSMCRTLKVDPAPVLEKLPQYVKPTLSADSNGLNATFRESRAKNAAMPPFLKGSAFQAVAVLLIAAVIVFFYPRAPEPDSPALASTGKAANPPLEAAPEPVFVPAPMVDASAPATLAATATAETTPSSNPVAPTSAPMSSVASPAKLATASAPDALVAGAATATLAATGATPLPTASAASGGAGVLVLRPKASSWVQVTDAKGVVQLRKTLQAGEVAQVGGTLPLAVIVGRADATVVEVRGKPLMLESITQDNVARFEVK